MANPTRSQREDNLAIVRLTVDVCEITGNFAVARLVAEAIVWQAANVATGLLAYYFVRDHLRDLVIKLSNNRPRSKKQAELDALNLIDTTLGGHYVTATGSYNRPKPWDRVCKGLEDSGFFVPDVEDEGAGYELLAVAHEIVRVIYPCYAEAAAEEAKKQSANQAAGATNHNKQIAARV